MLRALLAALLSACLLAQAAFADATPVQLILLYMPNVSNAGGKSGSGIAELVMPEGEVRINVADLPRLEDDKLYTAWLVNSSSNEFLRIGAFNTAESTGAARYENVLPDAIPNKHWNLLLLTVENGPDAERPGAKHSLAAVFPSAEAAPLPVALPNTGGDPDAPAPIVTRCTLPGPACSPGLLAVADWRLISVPGALVLSALFGAGYALGRRRS